MTKTSKIFALGPAYEIWQKDSLIDTNSVLTSAGLPQNLFKLNYGTLTIDEMRRFWVALEEHTSRQKLPLLFCQTISFESLVPPIFAAMCSPNFLMATKRLAEYKRLIAPMSLLITQVPQGLNIQIAWDEDAKNMPPSLMILELVFMTQIARLATRTQVTPLAVQCQHRIEPLDEYSSYFGVRPTLADVNSITFDQQDVERPFVSAHENLWSSFEPDLRHNLVKLDTYASIETRVRHVLLEALPNGQATASNVAERLNTTARSMQRQLQAEGTSFKEILLTIRKRLAAHYLKNTSIPIAEISFLLDYSSPSSFIRAHRKWSGQSPEIFRQNEENRSEKIPS